MNQFKRDKNQNSSKLHLDKYYTPVNLAKYCIDKTFEIIGRENITEIIEPSAGSGSFSNQIENCIAYDIEPEDESIKQQDFLQLELDYKKGRVFIGNPPFGERMKLARRFYKHAVKMGDYVAFILPISQLNNQSSLYEFDLIHSEDLGKQIYTDRDLHCCFNIYKRPESGKLNKRKLDKLKDIKIIRQDSKKYNEITDYDIRMCYWGDGSAGKILKEGEKYSAEYKIIILNDEVRKDVIRVLNEVNWHEELNKIAMLKIQQFHIHNVLKKYIKDIK